MAKVRILEKTVAERIAAGEVVERPASIIKELVENSLDAGATRIVVEIKAGGIKALRVSDNGCGMSPDDMALAIQRFATSKITDWNDLSSLTTLGFRGEALPSIAAVSRMRIKSCLPEQEGGAELYVEGAGVPLIKPCACPPGTRIEVSDLFYNTPARLKFLRSPVAEATNIIDMLGRMAVAHPEVHFRLISNDKEVFSFPIGMAMPQRLVKLWKIPDNTLIPIAKAVGDMVIDGYVALPYYTRNNRNNQLILLNGRVIRSSNLSQALQEGYAPLLPRGRFPVGAIRLFLPPDSFDVNVHPNKLEVRFIDTRPVFSLVYGAVSQALEQYHADTVQERHLYSKGGSSDRGATVPLRGLPVPQDGAKTSIDNLPASRPPGAPSNIPRPVRCRRDVDGKNHGLMGIINRIDAVNANLFPISASEKALAREREGAQRAADGQNPELEGTISVSMPHLAMRELAGYELLSKDGSKALGAAAPNEPKPVFDGTDTIGVSGTASVPSGFNGVDTLGCADAQGTSGSNLKGRQFSGTDTMGFDLVEMPNGTVPAAKTAGFPLPVVSESASKKYVADPLAATIIGLAPVQDTAGGPPASAGENALADTSALEALAAVFEAVPSDAPSAESAEAAAAGNAPAASPAVDPLASTIVEDTQPAVPPAAVPKAAPVFEDVPAASPAVDPLAATVFEGAPAASPVVDPLAATVFESVPAASSAVDPLAATVFEGAPAAAPAVDPLAATVFEGAPAAAAKSAPVFEDVPAASPAVDPLASTIVEDTQPAAPAVDPLASTIVEDTQPAAPAVDPLASTIVEDTQSAAPPAAPVPGSAKTDGEGVPSKAPSVFMLSHQEELPGVSSSLIQPAKSRFRLFGQVNNTFIVGLVDGELWIIDQHTAHERVNYERLGYLSPLQSRSQVLLVPEIIEFSPAASEYLASEPQELGEFGFVVEPFGTNTFQLRAVPSALEENRIQSVFRDLIEELAAGSVSVKRSVKETMREKLRAMTSCKAAVKAGEALSPADMKKLVDNMLRVEHSRYCPHGRPTRVIMDQRTLERLFHR